MPTATLTWSAHHGDSNLQSTFGATNQSAIQLLNQYLTALALFADFPWTVCSFEGTTAPWFVTLKRKDLSPGRIVFIGVTTAPGTTYNPQLGNLNWNTTGIRAAFFPSATSDTPANILSLSGDVFTNPGSCRGLGPTTPMITGANLLTAHANEDMLWVRYGTATTTTDVFIVGDTLEDDAGNKDSASFSFSGGVLDGVTPTTSIAAATRGGIALFSGISTHFGSGYSIPSNLSTYQRDNGTKQSWFYPRVVCNVGLPLGQAMKYKLRQIAFGPIPLAGYETLTDTGAVLKAISTYPLATLGYAWLTNFKV